MQKDQASESLDRINDFLIESDFKGLSPLQCLLKIMKENKNYREKNEDN